jgi:hypothetical protein
MSSEHGPALPFDDPACRKVSMTRTLDMAHQQAALEVLADIAHSIRSVNGIRVRVSISVERLDE